MEQKFERVEKHLTGAQYQTAGGEWATRYYGRFVCKLKKKRRVFPLGEDLSEARNKLNKVQTQDYNCHDFDLDRGKTRAEHARL